VNNEKENWMKIIAEKSAILGGRRSEKIEYGTRKCKLVAIRW
jgi:hypothetical protein